MLYLSPCNFEVSDRVRDDLKLSGLYSMVCASRVVNEECVADLTYCSFQRT